MVIQNRPCLNSRSPDTWSGETWWGLAGLCVSPVLRGAQSWKWHNSSLVKDCWLICTCSIVLKSFYQKIMMHAALSRTLLWAAPWSALWTDHRPACWLFVFAMWPKQASTCLSESERDTADLNRSFHGSTTSKTNNCLPKWRKKASMVSRLIFAFHFNENQMHRRQSFGTLLTFLYF